MNENIPTHVAIILNDCILNCTPILKLEYDVLHIANLLLEEHVKYLTVYNADGRFNNHMSRYRKVDRNDINVPDCLLYIVYKCNDKIMLSEYTGDSIDFGILMCIINHKYSHERILNYITTTQTHSYVPPDVESMSSTSIRGHLADSSSPSEVQSASPSLAESSSNYLPVDGRATPGDRGEGNEEEQEFNPEEQEVSDVAPSGLPAADLREAEGQLNREGHHGEWKTSGGGEWKDLKWNASGKTSCVMPNRKVSARCDNDINLCKQSSGEWIMYNNIKYRIPLDEDILHNELTKYVLNYNGINFILPDIVISFKCNLRESIKHLLSNIRNIKYCIKIILSLILLWFGDKLSFNMNIIHPFGSLGIQPLFLVDSEIYQIYGINLNSIHHCINIFKNTKRNFGK